MEKINKALGNFVETEVDKEDGEAVALEAQIERHEKEFAQQTMRQRHLTQRMELSDGDELECGDAANGKDNE